MWYKLLQLADWFGEMSDRYKLIRDFNSSAKKSFISGNAKTLLEAKVVSGDSNFKHAFSKFFGSGIRIKALSGIPLEKSELIEIGKIILDNEFLVRKLIALGWDTLEVHDNHGLIGCKWALKNYIQNEGYLA